MGDVSHEVDPAAPEVPGSLACARLMPIVHLLLANGNVPNTSGFVMRKDGGVYEMVYPIDFALVRERLELPPQVDLLESSDTILDRLTWCAITGPGALAANRVR
jgi:hypothetical protein